MLARFAKVKTLNLKLTSTPLAKRVIITQDILQSQPFCRFYETRRSKAVITCDKTLSLNLRFNFLPCTSQGKSLKLDTDIRKMYCRYIALLVFFPELLEPSDFDPPVEFPLVELP